MSFRYFSSCLSPESCSNQPLTAGNIFSDCSHQMASRSSLKLKFHMVKTLQKKECHTTSNVFMFRLFGSEPPQKTEVLYICRDAGGSQTWGMLLLRNKKAFSIVSLLDTPIQHQIHQLVHPCFGVHLSLWKPLLDRVSPCLVPLLRTVGSEPLETASCGQRPMDGRFAFRPMKNWLQKKHSK